MRELVELVQRVANCNAPVLLIGETGVGKEVVADLIHESSRGLLIPARPFIKVNMATLPKDLIEGELFGAAKGAFTGAIVPREGLFRAADRGTIFLDELSEMPVDLQSRLLRVLQEKSVRALGSTTSVPIDVRIVAAVNKAPDQLIKAGLLREDLYYRLSTISLVVPPLRERPEDIPRLASAYLAHYCHELEKPPMSLSPAALEKLKTYNWPGNVRQLMNEMNRLSIVHCVDEIQVSSLATEILNYAIGVEVHGSGLTMMARAEVNVVAKALFLMKGNKQAAAKLLGIGRQTLYNKLVAYDVSYDSLHHVVRVRGTPWFNVDERTVGNDDLEGLARMRGQCAADYDGGHEREPEVPPEVPHTSTSS